MNILLTGSNGFLGSHIYNYLKLSHNIETLNRSNSTYNFDLSKDIPCFLNCNYDLVIHVAGKAHLVPGDFSQSNSFKLINEIGTKNLLKGLLISGIPKRFVLLSSVSVYGLSHGINVKEVFKLNSDDAYGRSKIESEKLVINWCNENKVTCTILRLPLVVGPNPPGNLGSMIKGIKTGYYFNIAGGFSKKSMVLASDVSRFVLKSSEVAGIFNLTDGYHPSFFELSKIISHQLGKRTPLNLPIWVASLISIIGDLVGKYSPLNTNKLNKITSTLTFDDSKARTTFGWNPIPVLEGFKIDNSK